MKGMSPRHLIGFALALAAGGCGGGTPPPASGGNPPPATVDVSSGLDAERFFPLRDRYVYSYVVETAEGSGGMLNIRASRRDEKTGVLQMPTGPREFVYAPDGVVLGGTDGIYFLKWPLEIGTQWRGERGGVVSIVEVAKTVTVPAGTYQGCVKTSERRGGDRPMQIDTTVCPDVGIVELQAASGEAFERLSLKSYGPPVDLGPDGVRMVPPGTDDGAPTGDGVD